MKICNKNCNACKQLNIRTDDKGYPFGYECMKYDEPVDPDLFESTKEFIDTQFCSMCGR